MVRQQSTPLRVGHAWHARPYLEDIHDCDHRGHYNEPEAGVIGTANG